jgi:amino acid adenylation domain-containing protein
MAISSISLLKEQHVSHDDILQTAAEQCSVSLDDIDDLYPCTAAQEGLFALSARNPNSYVARYVYTISDAVDQSRFCRAIEATLDAHTILRTRLIQTVTHGMLQVVVRRQGQIVASADNLREYLQADCQQPMPPGSPLIRIALLDASNQPLTLVITIHHALYDDWSLNVVLHDIESAYNNSSLAHRAFADFTALSLSAQSDKSARFWQSQLESSSVSQFPRLPSSSYKPAAKASLIHNVCFPPTLRSEADQSAALELAWGMLLGLYTGSTDVLFGVTLTGRHALLPGIEDMSGPTIATIPLRVSWTPETKIANALQSLLKIGHEMLPFEQQGLYNISRVSDEAAAACQFQNLIVIQSPPQHEYEYFHEITQDQGLDNHATFGTYALTLVCDLRESGVRIQAVYDDQVIPATQMQRILNQFGTIVTRLAKNPKTTLGGLDVMSAEDIDQLKAWNIREPVLTEDCMHDLILSQCRAQPDASAIAAWDGQFSYGELERLSGRLAGHLVERGLAPQTFVPLYFEKSRWTTVAILAVMRIGAAFVLLDPSTPFLRNQSICRQTKSSYVLSSTTLALSATDLAEQVVAVGDNTDALLPRDSFVQQPVPSSSLLYCVFTSGSTGTPKGVQIEHGSFATSTKAYISASNMTKEIRLLQFSSYAFDVSISDTLVTLVAGGCICVPSEKERKSELAQVVARYNVNCADFTPTLLRHLHPEQFPSLRTIIVGGEPLSKAEVDTWGPHVRLLNIYGPAECCVLSTIQADVTPTTDPRDIGYGAGCTTWVVDPTDFNRLLPIGVVGELLLGGPTVGRGYLGDPQKTAAVFVDSNPSWMPSLRPEASATRFYRTGDLVQYTPQGSLRYISRKDTQLKLRGQRIDVEEVEYHIRRSYPSIEEAVVDAVSPVALDCRTQLVAFITTKDCQQQDNTNLFLSPTENFYEAVATAVKSLQSVLPSYMIPAYFLPVSHLLCTVSDKTDRRRLREAANALSADTLEGYYQRKNTGQKRAPVSELECKIQAIWAKALNVSPEKIALDDGFFQLGGDSITSMKVASIAKEFGLSISIPDLFQGATLESIARSAEGDIESVKHWDWEAETVLAADVEGPAPPINLDGIQRLGKVALTGSTGFLGQEVLRQLNANPAVKQIHCLAVRSQGRGVGRQSAAMQSDKVKMHSGDLSLPNLGLLTEEFANIIQDCDGIIHCGADISFVQNYELLKSPNVNSVKEIARLASKYSIPIHYTSSAALSHLTGLESFEEVSVRKFLPPADGEQGYLTSKWVSEVYLEKCNERYAVPVTIHRVSSIVGPNAPAMDITNNVLNMARKLHAMPDLTGCKGYVDLINVQNVASNIIGDVLSPHLSRSVKYIHESGEVRVHASELKDYLEREAGEPFEVLELGKWIQAARDAGMPELVAKFLGAMPPSEIDIAMPFLHTSRVNGRAIAEDSSQPYE